MANEGKPISSSATFLFAGLLSPKQYTLAIKRSARRPRSCMQDHLGDRHDDDARWARLGLDRSRSSYEHRRQRDRPTAPITCGSMNGQSPVSARNTVREDFTLTEAVAIKQAIEPMLKEEAKARMAAAGPATGRGKKATGSAKLAGPVKGKTRDKVAKRRLSEGQR
jgi:hypothetical protein